MTEFDPSPEALEQYRRTQQRIAHWVDDTDRFAPQFKSPFVPRSDVQDNEFYHPRSASSSRQQTPTPHWHRPQDSQMHHRTQPGGPSPLHADIGPNDSISQLGAASRPRFRRLRSHSSSPTRHSYKSSSHRTRAYVLSPPPATPYPGVQYGQQPVHYAQLQPGMQYASSQPMQYTSPYASPPAQGVPAAYIIDRDSHTVLNVYPAQTQVQYQYQYPIGIPASAVHPVQEHQRSGRAALLQRIFGGHSSEQRRSRSLSHLRSGSRQAH